MRGARVALAIVLVVLSLAWLGPRAPAVGAAPAWMSVAAPGVGRVGHTATPLADGTVLVVGGAGGEATAERYDPATDRWTPSSPAAPRTYHTASLLPDGRVLVVGGLGREGDPAANATAEIYDPASNRWLPAASPGRARFGHTATTLPDGRILVAGGASSTNLADVGATAEIFDPTTGRWSPAAPMIVPRQSHTATLLASGLILVAGGSQGTSSNRTLCELYDPATDRWVAAGSLITPRSAHRAVTLPDGQVLVAGGGNDAGPTAAAERYDPVRNTWFAVGPMAVARYQHTLSPLPDGRVIATGGQGDTVEFYDPATASWSPGPSLGARRDAHTATVLPGGEVLVVGGFGGGGERTAERYAEREDGPETCFAETGFCARGRFLAYWQAHGGLAINGYPISTAFTAILEDGQPYLVQYFERTRLEYHPRNAAPNDVLLGQFGRLLHPADPRATPNAAMVWFPETGHNVPADFYAYWSSNGGLAQFGYPLSEVFVETLEDGKSYQVQYFERARFERHPENQPPYTILLGQFGRRILAAR